MKDDMIYILYNEYWKKKLYKNIAETQRFIPIIFACVMLISSYLFTGELQLLFIILPLLYYSVMNMMMLILEKKLIKNFENFAGVIIFAFITFLKILLNYNFHKLDDNVSYTFRMAESQYFNVMSWLFINNYKTSFLCAIMNIITQIGFNYYLLGVLPDSHCICDMICFCFYFVSLCYIVQQLNYQLFITPSTKLIEAVTELSRAMDIMSEYLVILNIDEGNNISLYHSSVVFNNRYMNGAININEPINLSNSTTLKGIFEKFIYASKYDIEKDVNYSKRYSYSLLKDLNNLIEENRKDHNVNYKKNIYTFLNTFDTFGNTKNEYFEVKSTILTDSILGHQGYDQKSVLILIKNIDRETYQVKNQQITEIGNTIISTLTQELKNPLKGLYGQLDLINKENKSNLILNDLIEKAIEYDRSMSVFVNNEEDRVKNLIKNFNKNNNAMIENELEKYRSNHNIAYASSIIKTLLLCKYFNTIQKSKMSMRISKYLKSKINLIISNFEIYSKLKLKLTLNVKMNEINLSYLLNKCLKVLNAIVSTNNNKFKIDIKIANYCMIKTDPYIFKIIVRNIILLLEKRSKKAGIEVKVELNKQDSKLYNSIKNNHNSSIQIHFTTCISLNKLDDIRDIKSLDSIEIINKNNDLLHKLIDCKYEEMDDKENQLLRYTLIIPSYTLDEAYLNYDKINDEEIIPVEPDKLCFQPPDNKRKLKYSKAKHDNTKITRNNSKVKITSEQGDTIVKMNENLNKIPIKFEKCQSPNEINIPDAKYVSPIQKPLDLCSCFRVLIVDDDSLCISYMSNVVKKNNEIYELAYNGQEAYEKVKKLIDTNCQICDNKFLLIFMDIHMPVLNGVKSAIMIDDYLKLNKNANGYKCKLYFTSANLDTQFSDIINKISIYAGFMNKPIKRADLVKILEQDK